MAKRKQSQTPAAKAARARRAAAKDGTTEGTGTKDATRTDRVIPAGEVGLSAVGEKAKIPEGAKPTETEAEHGAQASANAAAEITRRRHEPGAEDAENDGPDIGRVDNRVDTSFETQGIPRPARPVTPVGATADRFAPESSIDEEPLTVDKGFPKKVRAIRMGYLRHSRRRAGDVFLIYNAAEFSPKWMEYAGSSDVEKITTGQQELEKQRRTSLEDRLAKKRAGTGDADVLAGATA